MTLNGLHKLALAATSLVAMTSAWACTNGLTAPSATSAPVAATSGGAGSRQVASAPDHLVSGSGKVTQMPGLEYRIAIDARLLPDGTATGSVTTNILDISAFNLDKNYLVINEIDCLEFDGSTVWFGGPQRQSTLPGISDPDARVIGKITDSGSGDTAFGGPAKFYTAPGTTCHDRPALLALPVSDGDFKVR